jgi:hypothetical protein
MRLPHDWMHLRTDASEVWYGSSMRAFITSAGNASMRRG